MDTQLTEPLNTINYSTIQQNNIPSYSQLQLTEKSLITSQPKDQIISKIQQQKTQYSRSYLFKVPILDQKVEQQLQKYRITQIKQYEDVISNVNQRLLLQNDRTIAIYSFSMVTIFQLALFLFYFINVFLSSLTQKIAVFTIEIAVGITYIGIVTYIAWDKKVFLKYDRKQFTLFIMSWIGFISSAVGQFTGIKLINLIVLAVLVIMYVVVFVKIFQFKNSTQSNLYFYPGIICICMMVLFGQLTFRSVCTISTDKDKTYLYLFVALIGIQLLFLAFIKIKEIIYQQVRLENKYTFFETCCVLYVEVAGFAFALTTAFQISFGFVIFTQIINLLYIALSIYFFRQIKKVIEDIEQNKQKLEASTLYQKSDIQLTSSKDQYLSIKEQLTTNHLTSCILCLSQQSRFYYEACMHVCCGYDCILSWLKSEKPNCPLCRCPTELIGEIKRINDYQFIILHKYRAHKIQE